MSEKINVIPLFKTSMPASNVIEIPKKVAKEPIDHNDTYKKVSGGYDVGSESLIREGFDSALICKGGLFGGNVKLFVLHRDGRFEKVQNEAFKDKVEMLKFAFSNFDTTKVDFKPLV